MQRASLSALHFDCMEKSRSIITFVWRTIYIQWEGVEKMQRAYEDCGALHGSIQSEKFRMHRWAVEKTGRNKVCE